MVGETERAGCGSMPYVTDTRGIGFNMKNNDSPFFALRPLRVVLISGFFALLLCFACFVFQYRKINMERHAKAKAQHAAKTKFKELFVVLEYALLHHGMSGQRLPRSFDGLCDMIRQHQSEISKIHVFIPPDVEWMIQHRSDPWGTNFFVDVHASDENDRLYIVSIIFCRIRQSVFKRLRIPRH